MVSLSDDERKVFQDAEHILTLAKMPGWNILRDLMIAYEQDALRDMAGCVSSDDRLRANLQLRWQARKDFVQMLDNFIRDTDERKKMIMKALAEAQGLNPMQAYDVVYGENHA